MCAIAKNEDAPQEDIGTCLDVLNLALGRYMVALGGSFLPTYYDGVPSGQPTFFCFPGFVLSIRDFWLFVTAGHNLRAILRSYGDKQNKWTGMAWSHFIPETGGNRTRPLDNTVDRPFYFKCDVAEHEQCEIGTATEDWGVLELTATERQWLIEAGVKPFTLDDLKTRFDADGYVLIGLPTELFDKVKIDEAGATNSVDPTIIGLNKRDDLIRRANGQWYVGDLPDEATFSIHGMSGGPLFAFDCENWNVWIAGIQSHWCETTRLAFVCPVQTILDHLPAKFRP
jgi:hypothetical protein